MSDCATCGASFDCIDPLSLYSLESVTFPFVPVCPQGVVCDIGSDFHLVCCQEDIFIQFPPGFDAIQKQAVIAGAVAECQRQAAFCPIDPCPNPPCTPCPEPPCTVYLFWNRPQTCSVDCPDGTPFQATIAGGKYLAPDQITADTFAFKGACARAKDHRICLSTLDTPICADASASLEIKGTGKYLASGTGSDYWEVIDGAVPTGMTFQGGFRSDRKCVIDGTPTTAGIYTFTVRVTVWTAGEAFGDYTEKTFTVKVVGILPATLPDATIGTLYSQNLTVTPDHDQETETWRLDDGFSLPDGLELTEAGVIHGTPTGPSESHDVQVQVTFTLDKKEVTCTKEWTLTVNDGPLLSYWKMDETGGTRADSLGHDDLALISGNPVGSTTGKISLAARIPNSNATIGLRNVTSTHLLPSVTKGFTIAGWVNFESFVVTPGFINVDRVINFFSLNGASVVILGLTLQTYGYGDGVNLPPLQFIFDVASGTAGMSEQIVGPSITAGAWYFFVLWFDPADGLCHIQFNNGAVLSNVTPITIGASVTAGIESYDPSLGFGGPYAIDEVGAWATVLTPAQRTSLYNAGAGRTYPDVPYA